MKFARVAMTAIAVVLVVSVFVMNRQVSGQDASTDQDLSNVVRPAGDAKITSGVGQQHLSSLGTNSRLAAPDPELAKVQNDEARVQQEAAALTEEYSRTEDEGQRAKIKAKLSGALQKQFDLQQKRRDLEVARIETQLKKLQELMRKRSEARKTIIEKRLDQLLQEADGLGWTAPLGAPNYRSGRNLLPQLPGERLH
jgi:hypothetical protein